LTNATTAQTTSAALLGESAKDLVMAKSFVKNKSAAKKEITELVTALENKNAKTKASDLAHKNKEAAKKDEELKGKAHANAEEAENKAKETLDEKKNASTNATEARKAAEQEATDSSSAENTKNVETKKKAEETAIAELNVATTAHNQKKNDTAAALTAKTAAQQLTERTK